MKKKKRRIKKSVVVVLVLLLAVIIGGIILLIPKGGWEETSLGKKYKDSKSDSYLVGANKIGGKWYYFDESGLLQIGWIEQDGTLRYADREGVLLTGLQTVDNKLFFFNEDGTAANEWQTVGDKLYYAQNGEVATGLITVGDDSYFFGSDGVVKDGLFEENGVTYYADPTDHKLAEGVKTVDGKTYCFVKGAASTGWVVLGNTRYYFYDNGTMATNATIDGRTIGPEGKAGKVPATPGNLNAYLDDYLEKYGRDEKGIYNAVRDNVYYKYADHEATMEETACAAINNGKGACWHFASLGYLLYQRAGYEVKYIVGKGRPHDGPTGYGGYDHNWLYVKFKDGNWYYVDPVYLDGAKMSETTVKKKYTSWSISEFPAN